MTSWKGSEHLTYEQKSSPSHTTTLAPTYEQKRGNPFAPSRSRLMSIRVVGPRSRLMSIRVGGQERGRRRQEETSPAHAGEKREGQACAARLWGRAYLVGGERRGSDGRASRPCLSEAQHSLTYGQKSRGGEAEETGRRRLRKEEEPWPRGGEKKRQGRKKRRPLRPELLPYGLKNHWRGEEGTGAETQGPKPGVS